MNRFRICILVACLFLISFHSTNGNIDTTPDMEYEDEDDDEDFQFSTINHDHITLEFASDIPITAADTAADAGDAGAAGAGNSLTSIDRDSLCASFTAIDQEPIPIVIPHFNDVSDLAAIVRVKGRFLHCIPDSVTGLFLLRKSVSSSDTPAPILEFLMNFDSIVAIDTQSQIGADIHLARGNYSVFIQGLETGEIFDSIDFEVFSRPMKFTNPTKFYITSTDDTRIGVEIHIGRGSYPVNPNELAYRFADDVDWTIQIGQFCSLAAQTRFVLAYSKSHNYRGVSTFPLDRFKRDFGKQLPEYLQGNLPPISRPRSVIIGNDVWVGDSVVFVNTLNIGDGAVIGASSVVRSDVPPYAIVVGNPAVIVGYRFSDRIISELLSLKWWDKSDEEVFHAMMFGDDIEGLISYFKAKNDLM